jgi:hypothetical protein
MIVEGGVPMVRGMPGSAGGWWARNLDGELIQHSFWLFDTEENARTAEATSTGCVKCPTLRPHSSRGRLRIAGSGVAADHALSRMQESRPFRSLPRSSPHAQPAASPGAKRRERPVRGPCFSAVARVAPTTRSRSPPTAELCDPYNRRPSTGDRQLAGRRFPKGRPAAADRRHGRTALHR